MDEMMVTVRDLLAELKDAESEARNELSRLRLSGQDDGPAYRNWEGKRRKWAATIARVEHDLYPGA